MSTRIEVDDQLITQAMQTGRFTTQRQAVEAGLRRMIRLHETYQGLLALRGKVHWSGDDDDLDWSKISQDDSESDLQTIEKSNEKNPGNNTF